MNNITIAPALKEKWEETTIASISCDVRVQESEEALKFKIQETANYIQENLTREEISQLPPIRSGRRAYKKLGKDPARYRLSSEALLRRIVSGKGLFLVNNIVDINNLVSIKSYYPICAFDADKLNPPVTFTIGNKEDIYHGIGRGMLNIADLPAFADQEGKMGTPTSDSERVKINNETTRISMNIVSFQGTNQLEKHLNELEKLLVLYAHAKNSEKVIIT